MAPRKVGTCRIVRELGRGGMGVVFEAVQEGLDRRVAVKALEAMRTRTDDVVERFRREGRAYAQLRHEAVVAVHDLVEKEDAIYLVTELVDGADLVRILAQGGPLPPDCVAVLGARLAEALEYVHFHGLLHRDVKPSNVMISREGEVKLLDFGIAKNPTLSDLTREGVVVGSPPYMAPELLVGEEGDARVDVWGLGVTLYELAGGRKPFDGGTHQALFKAVRTGKFPKLRSLAPGVPRRLARAIEHCLRVKPGDRWASAGALARELGRCAERALRGRPWRQRLVALLTHRGFVVEAEALSRIDASALQETLVLDTAMLAAPPSPQPSPWRWIAPALVALGAGLAAWLVRC
jgi:serine/threonine-protein kinase